MKSGKDCPVCERIRRIRSGRDAGLVCELETGYLVLEDRQVFPGWCVFLCKRHVPELHLLDPGFRLKFLAEMSLASEAVFRVVKPRKLNYELLGNVCPHLHWHLIPRYIRDPVPLESVWEFMKSGPDPVPVRTLPRKNLLSRLRRMILSLRNGEDSRRR